MDAGRGRGRGRGRGVAAAGRGAAVVGAAGRGAAGRGRGAAGRGAAGRGAAVLGGAAGRGGRGAGRGLPEAEVSAESAAPSVGTASVTQSVSLAGGANFGAGHGAGVGVGRGAGVGVDAGAGAAPGFGGAAQAQGDLLLGLLTQLLARLPEAVPQQAPVAPPVAGAQVGAGAQAGAGFVEQQQAAGFEQQAAGFVGQQQAAVGDLPAYREAMREMQRIGTPTFEGGVTSEQADEWRQRVERNFESVRCPEQFQVQIAVHYLGGDAFLWWRSIRTSREVWTWVDFVEEFNYKFFPQEARDRFQLRFLELSQGERSVREYDAEFSRLLVLADIGGMTERTLMGKFLQGLRQDIKKLCRGKMYHTRAELVELAASTEEDLREPVRAAVVPAAVASATQPRGQHQQQRRNFSSGHGRGGRPQYGQKRRAEEISASSQSGACFGCGSLDHRVSACPKRAASIEKAVCYHCRETGHIRPMCPRLQQRAVGSVAAVQPLAIQSAAQVAALQPGSGGAPRVYTSQEAGQTSQSGQITGIILIQTS